MTSSVVKTRRPRPRKALTPWLCGGGGGGSEVDVILPDRYTTPKPARKTTTGQTGRSDHLQERCASRSAASAATLTPGRSRSNRQYTTEGREPSGVGGGQGFRAQDQKQKQNQQGEGFRRRQRGSSDPAQLRHHRDGESQAVVSGTSRGRSRRSNSIDASASMRQQGKHEAANSSFNLGLGAALLYLSSRGATEFHKLVELRKDTEALLNKIQDAVARLEAISPHAAAGSRNNDDAVKTNCSSTTTLSSSTTMNKENTSDCCHTSTSAPPLLPFDSLGDMPLTQHSDACSNTEVADSQARMMEQLEAELESELQRLELNLTMGRCEDPHESTGLQEFVNQSEFVREYAVMSWSNGLDYERNGLLQENRDEDDRYHHHQNNGVCPYKLERKLRELLETRQLDNVEHPDYALQSPERGLQDIEMEIFRWRNEAHLASSHIEPVAGH